MLRALLLLATALPGLGLATDTPSIPGDNAVHAIPASAPATPPTSALASAPAAPVDAGAPLASGSHRYHFEWDGQVSGTAVRSLLCEQQRCRLHSEASVPGIATLQETSQFDWQDGQVVFGDYVRTLQVFLFPQVVKLTRGADGNIQAERKGKVRRYPAQAGLLDPLTLEAQLRADLMRDGKPRSRYLLADVKGVKTVKLEELPRETLTVAGQKVPTRVFRRQNEEGNRVTTLWLDPQQQFLPIRILHRDGVETYHLHWLGKPE